MISLFREKNPIPQTIEVRIRLRVGILRTKAFILCM